jgi:type IV pilus assembly protein PilW
MKSARGFSLIEFMIAMTVGLIMLAGIVSIFYSTKQTYLAQDSSGRMQENGRFSLISMERDVRAAGYRGCIGDHLALRQSVFSTTANTVINPALYSDNFTVEIQGFEGTGGGWSPALDPALAVLVPSPNPNSDILTVRAAVGAGVPVTTAMASKTDNVTVAAGSGIVIGNRVMVSNCVKAAVFTVSAVTGTGTLTHTATDNATTNLGWAFGTDSYVMPMQTTTYYVGASPAAAALPGGLSLYRVRGTNAPEELVDGVDQMKILYGESISGELVDGNVTAEHYVPASGVTAMANVVSAKVSMLMRSADAAAVPVAQAYRFGGNTVTAADLRMRRAYQTTIDLRNRTK